MSRATRVLRGLGPADAVRWLWLFLFLAVSGGVGTAVDRPLFLQVRVTAHFSGIPIDEIRPAAKSAAVDAQAGQSQPLKSFDYTACLSHELKQAFQKAARSQEVVMVAAEAKPVAAQTPLLLVEVSKWGFRYSPADKNKGNNRKGQLEHLVRYTVKGSEGQASHRELFLSGKQRFLQEYRDDEVLLVSELRASIKAYAGLLANKVLNEK
jgi:hypothetical protein